MNSAILTAAFNEAEALPRLVKNMPEGYDLFVVDDGSDDDTGKVARSLGARVFRHCINLGQGYAFITGIKAIVSNGTKEYDYIAFIDADGQHDPSEIPHIIATAEQERWDVAVGSRIRGSNYSGAPFLRRTFLPVYTHIVNKLTGYRMTDAMSGFRVFRVSGLRKILHVFDEMLEPQYLASEMFMRFSKEGLIVGEVPIQMGDRLIGHSYKGTIRYGWGVLKAIVRTSLDRSYRKNQKQRKP